MKGWRPCRSSSTRRACSRPLRRSGSPRSGRGCSTSREHRARICWRSWRALPGRPMAGEPRILLADDDDIGRYVVATMLRRAAFAVSEVADGVAAVNTAATDLPDLVILDVKMPGFDG